MNAHAVDERVEGQPGSRFLDSALGWVRNLYVPRLHDRPTCLALKPESLTVVDVFAVVFKDNGPFLCCL